jgi:hypothetical protein
LKFLNKNPINSINIRNIFLLNFLMGKREADHQLTNENYLNGNGADGEVGTFKIASKQELERREIKPLKKGNPTKTALHLLQSIDPPKAATTPQLPIPEISAPIKISDAGDKNVAIMQKLASLNKSFSDRITSLLAGNKTINLSILCDDYKKFRTEIVKKIPSEANIPKDTFTDVKMQVASSPVKTPFKGFGLNGNTTGIFSSKPIIGKTDNLNQDIQANKPHSPIKEPSNLGTTKTLFSSEISISSKSFKSESTAQIKDTISHQSAAASSFEISKPTESKQSFILGPVNGQSNPSKSHLEEKSEVENKQPTAIALGQPVKPAIDTPATFSFGPSKTPSVFTFGATRSTDAVNSSASIPSPDSASVFKPPTDSSSSKSNFSFGIGKTGELENKSSNTIGFTFGQSLSSDSVAPNSQSFTFGASSTTFPASKSFSFESSVSSNTAAEKQKSFSFNLGAPPALNPTFQLTKKTVPEEEGTSDSVVEDAMPTLEQVGDALMKGEGEEGETTLFQVKSKLFIQVMKENGEKSWESLGVGLIKVNDSEKSSRILCRADSSGRVLLNSRIYNTMPIVKISEKQFSAIVQIDGELKTLLIRVGKPDDCEQLLSAIEKCKTKK